MAAETILVVDDDSEMLEVLRDVLVLAGFQVTTAGNGQEALASLHQRTPHLVVSDIGMPVMDGYELYAHVRARPQWTSIPFIFVTGKGEEDDVREGRKLGAEDYLVKPVREPDLLATVRGCLERRAQLDTAREWQVAELKRSILATLNHELGTPLTYLAVSADLLRDSSSKLDREQMSALITAIQAGTERLRRLVEDLIMLVDLQSGAAQRAFDSGRRLLTGLPEVLQTVLSQHRAWAEARRVRLIDRVSPDLPPLRGEPELLSCAVSRLLDNGIKFSKKQGGDVVLSARPTERHVVIEVADQGVGIPQAELGKIFDLFYQIDRSRNEQQGCGAGLTVARGIVVLHGGVLTVHSQDGVGSTFTIELPRATSLGPSADGVA